MIFRCGPDGFFTIDHDEATDRQKVVTIRIV
jgi:hypothetical protein